MEISGWENMYRAGERGSEEHPTSLLTEIAPKLKPGWAIDLACGTGRNAIYLAQLGWAVTAVDGSETAVRTLRERAHRLQLSVETDVVDLADAGFQLPRSAFDLVVIAFYWQPELLPSAMAAVRAHGVVLVIAHIAEAGEDAGRKRARTGELEGIFRDWEILWSYEGASRDPAHRRPVAEIVARKL